MLYKKLFEDTKNIKKITITSAIPYNKASEQFHTKLGFQKIGKIIRDDGGSNFIYENT
jgi:predicted GNAT superfamily acetyltransferase